jgi:quercetin dioxygenase-like cupin family protein
VLLEVQASTPRRGRMSEFVDDRGWIRDVLREPFDSVTRIFTVKGAVRGNHWHAKTTQYTYVLSGRLEYAEANMLPRAARCVLSSGDMITTEPNFVHAWKALEDADCLVFTRGPRSGEDYESDTFRLAVEDRLI